MWVLKHLTSFKKKIICDVDCIPFKHGRTDILECRVCLYKDMSMSKMVHPPTKTVSSKVATRRRLPSTDPDAHPPWHVGCRAKVSRQKPLDGEQRSGVTSRTKYLWRVCFCPGLRPLLKAGRTPGRWKELRPPKCLGLAALRNRHLPQMEPGTSLNGLH